MSSFSCVQYLLIVTFHFQSLVISVIVDNFQIAIKKRTTEKQRMDKIEEVHRELKHLACRISDVQYSIIWLYTLDFSFQVWTKMKCNPKQRSVRVQETMVCRTFCLWEGIWTQVLILIPECCNAEFCLLFDLTTYINFHLSLVGHCICQS